MRIDEELKKKLARYFSARKDIAFSFLFGSLVKGDAGYDSDIDIAVYFSPLKHNLDIEDSIVYPHESDIWNELEKITGSEVDLVVLNRASSTICASVYLEGEPLFIMDKSLFDKHFILTTDLAEDYRYFINDYLAIKTRSKSLSPIDKTRLITILDFLESELKDTPAFTNLDKKEYLENSTIRRNTERWIENLVNASIDIAKIILASRRQPVPQTYREVLLRLDTIEGIDPETARLLSSFSRLRNILAHEYLDIRYPQIRDFLNHAPDAYKKLVQTIREIYTGTDIT